jgi:hypothetical protein
MKVSKSFLPCYFPSLKTIYFNHSDNIRQQKFCHFPNFFLEKKIQVTSLCYIEPCTRQGVTKPELTVKLEQGAGHGFMAQARTHQVSQCIQGGEAMEWSPADVGHVVVILPDYLPDCRPEDRGIAHSKPVHYSLQGGLSHIHCYLYPKPKPYSS